MSDLTQFFGEQGFDHNQYEPAKDFEFIPAGEYIVFVESAEMKPTKAGTGHFLELVMVISGGPHNGRKIWDRLNIDNPSEKAREIANRSMAALAKSANICPLKVAGQLVGAVVVAHVKVKDKNNDVKTYSAVPPLGLATSPQQAPPPLPAAPQAQLQDSSQTNAPPLGRPVIQACHQPLTVPAQNVPQAAPVAQPAAAPMYQQPAMALAPAVPAAAASAPQAAQAPQQPAQGPPPWQQPQ